MRAADQSGVGIARIPHDLAAHGDGLRHRPVLRTAEDAPGIYDATTQDAGTAMVVVVAQQAGLRIKDQARGGAGNVTNVGLGAGPGLPVVRGDDLELRRTGLRTGDGENPAITKINGGGFRGPVGFG